MKEKIASLQEYVDKKGVGEATTKVLEAGCGSASHLHFSDHAYMVGIDISAEQLKRNKRLNEKILGDLQDYHFPPSSFDVIVCWDVLEHLSKPELVLREFLNAIKENGIIVLKMPNVLSVKGLVTKLLPLSFHVSFYRHVHKRINAGKEDVGPFKTFLRWSIAPQSIKRFAGRNGLRIGYYDTFDVANTEWLKNNKIVYAAYMAVNTIFKAASFGFLGDSDFAIVLQKEAGKSGQGAEVIGKGQE